MPILNPLVLASSDDVWLMIFVIVIVSVVLGTVKSIVRTNAKERTRREIAAYIAEGSITPEQGERLMKAGKSHDEA
ncbi:MAG: hypothetical protein ACKVS8_05215 [Phycisphaerales bacterium]